MNPPKNLSVYEIGRVLPWETVIPASLFLCSALCYARPELFPSILFGLLAFAGIFLDSIGAYITRRMSWAISESLTVFSDDRQNQQINKVITTVKNFIIGLLTDEELHAAAIRTLQSSLIQASENTEFRDTALDVTKRAFVGALSDEKLIGELVDAIVDAIVSASQNEKLRKTMLEVVTQGMSDALEDEKFVSIFRGAVRDTLKDKDLYRAGARGILAAANPFSNAPASSSSSEFLNK